MPPDQQDVTAARLAALGLGPGGPRWVPEQPQLQVAAADPARGPGAEPARPTRPEPAHAAAGSPSPLLDVLADRMPPWLRGLTAAPTGRALLALGTVCAVCLGVTGWTLLHRPAAPVYPPPSAAAVVPLPTPTVAGLVVDVGGRVRRPGLVTLSPGARVADALDAAGGVLRPRDVATVDLAARVNDGELLLIGVAGGVAPAGGTGAAASGTTGPVDLNAATVDQLDELPGIGPVLAQRIVDWRTQHGGFRSVDDLDDVSGIGDAIFAELQPLVRV